jgi:hypothetical protein
MTEYFSKRSGLVGYSAGGSGYTDKLVTQMALYGCQQWGTDAFWPVHYYDAHWYSTLETGEIRLVQEGQKASIYGVDLHTSIESNAYFNEAPDAIVQMIGVGDVDDSGDEKWTTGGDSNGTISVTTALCSGTGTAWSTLIDYGDGATVAFTTQAAAAKCRVYLGSTAQVLDTDYTITGTKQITFTSAPSDGTSVIAYWTGEPRIIVKAGDYIETSYGLHRITAITTATQMVLEWFPPATAVGTHLPAQQLSAGEAETQFGLRGTSDRVRFKIHFIPRTHPDSVRYIKDIAFSVEFVPAGTRQLEE